jgi:hypothetical protein
VIASPDDDRAGAAARADRPVVALVGSPGSTAPLRTLVAALARDVEVISLGRAVAPDAVLVADRVALRRAPAGVPTAVVDGRVAYGATDGPEGGQAIALPGAHPVATARWPPIAPHVRRRWRERLGLAPDLVVDTAALGPDDVPTALAVAAAAVVEARHLALALCLGCPTVTDGAAARAVGAIDDQQLVVGDRAAATALAHDDVRAARLSRAGRAHAVRHLDPDVAACALLRAWRLTTAVLPIERVEVILDELGTAAGSPVRARVAAALDLLRPLDPVGAP